MRVNTIKENPKVQTQSSVKVANLFHYPYLFYIDPKNDKEVKYPITLETTNIGRKEDNDLALLSKYISRYHARIEMEIR
jgi:hypothetical protein